ncbi:MAG TPA: hypothetical protein VKS22_15205 [Candidatus Binataceae bacterium]|nr:hypothetical protein [Candidatus Binataceae bacterium]
MPLHKMLPAILMVWFFAIGTGAAHAQGARTTAKDAASAFPCPSGDTSCGNGAPAASGSPPANNIAPQNSVPDSNPNQKIEDEPSNDVDEGVAEDLREMNREAMRHEVNRPK